VLETDAPTDHVADLQAATTPAQDEGVRDVDTRYAATPDGVYIAYQTAGSGPIDVVWQPAWPGNVDMQWEFPVIRALLEGLASFSRLIDHDHRGVGLSSRNVAIPNLETRVADMLTVLEDVGSTSPVLVGWGSAGAVNALLAATRPERVSSLVWMDPVPRYEWAPDHPWGRTPEESEAELVDLQLWGTDTYGRAFAEDQAAADNVVPESEFAALAKASRNACTPDIAIELGRITPVKKRLPSGDNVTKSSTSRIFCSVFVSRSSE
jgi:pimeloyl-ACP methyl ester carboxylesterase